MNIKQKNKKKMIFYKPSHVKIIKTSEFKKIKMNIYEVQIS
jgi:hypothetical protein